MPSKKRHQPYGVPQPHVPLEKDGGIDEIRTNHDIAEFSDKKKYILVAVVVIIIAIFTIPALL